MLMASKDLPAAARPLAAALSLALYGPRLWLDLARTQYDAGVHWGLLRRSLLESAAFEHRLARLEAWLLGPWARMR